MHHVSKSEMEKTVQRYLEGGGSPALRAFRKEVAEKLAAAGMATLKEWAEQRPGEHLSAFYGKYPSCALCGHMEPRGGFKGNDCRGITRITMRGEEGQTALQNAQRNEKTTELMHRACEAAKIGIDTVMVIASNWTLQDVLPLIGSMRREEAIRPKDTVAHEGNSTTVSFVGGGQLFITTSMSKGQRWAKMRGRQTGRHPEWMREIDADHP